MSSGEGSGAALPQLGAVVHHDGKQIGTIVNAGFSFTLNAPIALALLDVDYAYVGLEYGVGDGPVRARTASAPFILNRSLGIRFQERSYFTRGE
jgi:glycine cleavage system aminomethyltransferase T